ncbi:hypothetical protein PoB_005092900 [Plakobranchus ocellatus]|uniref:Uncharacterized protein n=1 Tax=Plakobranchus ocellatus TaxID=259542 RepID=A0AAV4BW44_9GAST|nr:hypothetical protein PoB_005092900 [Plakobranchus ocellatus]
MVSNEKDTAQQVGDNTISDPPEDMHQNNESNISLNELSDTELDDLLRDQGQAVSRPPISQHSSPCIKNSSLSDEVKKRIEENKCKAIARRAAKLAASNEFKLRHHYRCSRGIMVEDPIADLIVGNCGHISDNRLMQWVNDSNSDFINSKEQHSKAKAVTRAKSRAAAANASNQNKDEPKTELYRLDCNVFRKEVKILWKPDIPGMVGPEQ